MRKILFTITVTALIPPGHTLAQVPPGFELVKVTKDSLIYNTKPAINNAGQVVYSSLLGETWAESEVFLYDNGATTQITDNEDRDVLPDINDDGTIAWCGGFGNGGCSLIWQYQNGQISLIWENPDGTAHPPTINNVGHIAWTDDLHSTPCGDIFSVVRLYDGHSVSDIYEDIFHDQTLHMNDLDQLVWAVTGNCGSDLADTIAYHSGGVTEMLTDGVDSLWPRINNAGEVVWWAHQDSVIRLWRPGAEPVIVANKAALPDINEQGQIAFSWRVEGTKQGQIGLYQKGQSVQITYDGTTHNDVPKINNWGEIVWQQGFVWDTNIILMQRIRNGEANFDGKVDAEDNGTLVSCLTGPTETDRLADCRFLDIDHDRDVDLGDFALLQTNFGWQAPLDPKHPHGLGETQ